MNLSRAQEVLKECLFQTGPQKHSGEGFVWDFDYQRPDGTCGCEICYVREILWSAFCIQWVVISWAATVGRE